MIKSIDFFAVIYDYGLTPHFVSGLGNIQLNEWYHVATVQTGPNLKLYVNGQLIDETNGNSIKVQTKSSSFVGKSNWDSDESINMSIFE